MVITLSCFIVFHLEVSQTVPYSAELNHPILQPGTERLHNCTLWTAKPFDISRLIDWLIDCLVFYAASAIFQPCNGGLSLKTNISYTECMVFGYSNPPKIVNVKFIGRVLALVPNPLKYMVKLSFFFNLHRFKDFWPSDKYDNPYLIIPFVTNDNSEHLCELVSGTCFRMLSSLIYLHEHCPYITYTVLMFLLSEFYYNFTKMLAVGIDLQHSYCLPHHTI